MNKKLLCEKISKLMVQDEANDVITWPAEDYCTDSVERKMKWLQIKDGLRRLRSAYV